MIKKCLNCHKKFNAVPRQKYCSVKCKDQYHYRLRKGIKSTVANINNKLNKNRRILHELLANKKNLIVFASNLKSLGFECDYHTHIKKVGKYDYFFCYEYGFRFIDNERISLIKMIYD
ncbi:MAG: hypothetical protein Kow0068_07950 [Marinilabiliales bacterium]